MKDHESEITLKFKFIAKFYDLFDLVFLFDKKTDPRYVLARQIPDEPFRILDVCVGTANSSLAVARANRKNEIVGIDLSPDMLAVAQHKLLKRGIRAITLLRMDAAKMTFHDGEFDIVMISFGLHEMDYGTMINTLREMYRVLREKGMLYIVDYDRQDGFVKRLIFSIYLKLIEPKHMREFLSYDWPEILHEIGFNLTEIKKCLFSKVISATK